jgi:hypothetical protein
MTSLIAHQLHLICTTTTALELPVVRGPVLRGALVQALLAEFCPVRGGTTCGTPILAAVCPICSLLATVEENAERGADVPRPFTIEPPLGSNSAFASNDPFEFGLTLFGDAVALLPYLLAGITRMGRGGIGDRRDVPGHFRLREVWAVDPLRGCQRRLMTDDEATITMPHLPITHAAASERAERLPRDAIALELLTPLRLVSDGKLVHALTFDVLLRRLLRRLDQLALATTGRGLDLPFAQLVEAAGSVRVASDETRWLDASSHSSRTGRSAPIGGLVGKITFAGDLGPFLPWLAWGEVTHVGKDATKGNGWYRLTRVSTRN